MRDEKRIERIIRKVEWLWKLVPDWRLGQLVSNIAGKDPMLFYLEDEDLEPKLDAWIEYLEKGNT